MRVIFPGELFEKFRGEIDVPLPSFCEPLIKWRGLMAPSKMLLAAGITGIKKGACRHL
ncbi:hypothetical protein [Methylophilus luteus]|uniref:Uncharacterized protein n=1 Tax=Methylophilus luteus TaxID=640108 RepID=A0ABW3F9R3_9PROT